mmetsp:Transcript_43155/g.80121  ORF Transcript_43155/g.80121 Transcript_43155/m.80121 type:complete len:214 (+) Transcript_43155:1519-2160(+)
MAPASQATAETMRATPARATAPAVGREGLPPYRSRDAAPRPRPPPIGRPPGTDAARLRPVRAVGRVERLSGLERRLALASEGPPTRATRGRGRRSGATGGRHASQGPSRRIVPRGGHEGGGGEDDEGRRSSHPRGARHGGRRRRPPQEKVRRDRDLLDGRGGRVPQRQRRRRRRRREEGQVQVQETHRRGQVRIVEVLRMWYGRKGRKERKRY